MFALRAVSMTDYGGPSQGVSTTIGRYPAWLFTVFKIAIAAALITWMLRRGVLDLTAVGSALTHWPDLLLMAAISYLQMGLLAWRWGLLLRAQNLSFRFRDTFALTMIGALFTLVTPSSVGGDLMKSYYVHQRAKDRSAEALTTIVLDRVLGLLSLLLVSALAALPILIRGSGNSALTRLCEISVLGAAGGTLGLTYCFYASKRGGEEEPANRIARFLVRAFRSLASYRQKPSALVAATAAGMSSFVLSCVTFYLAAHALGVENLPLRFLVLVPLGLLTTALPLSPSGIGVGQLAFAELFRVTSNGEFTFGANVFTVFQSVVFVISLSGFFFYISYRNRPASAGTDDLHG